MGCDIHLITQIKKGKKWEYVKEVPESLDNRNYHTFAIISGVRDDFDSQLFEPKGLPKDIGELKFGWESDFEYIKKAYETYTTCRCLLPNGEYISRYDDRLKRKCTKEEYDNWQSSKEKNNNEYYIYDCSILNGKLVEVQDKELYTFEEYLEKYFKQDYDKTMNDYGSWNVDFSCEDLHTPSYLTLKELVEKDYSPLFYEKCKVVKSVIDAFIKLGGKFPKGMEVIEDKPNDIASCVRYLVEPTMIIKWKKDDIKEDDIPLMKGIKELKEIAEKYNITNYNNIRIVFAFDN